MVFGFCLPLAGQQPPHCAQNLFCLFNQEAAAPSSEGVHKYSKDLIGLIVFNPAGDDSLRQITNRLENRLATAEEAARAGSGKLVSETAVVKAFNDLMQEIGAPPSMKANEASVHGFREHTASIKAFPALFSANRNGTNCNPGEAVFLLSLLLSDNGTLYNGNLDTAVELMHWDPKRGGATGLGFGVAGLESMSASASGLLLWYSSHHNIRANMALFNQTGDTLGL